MPITSMLSFLLRLQKSLAKSIIPVTGLIVNHVDIETSRLELEAAQIANLEDIAVKR